MADYDGDLTNVNPDLLKLCANAEDWREQRRRAMKAKIFGSGGDGQPNPNAYLPSDGTAGPSPSSAPAPSPSQLPASQQASESYILQQILSHKRRRDEANQQSASCGSPATQPTAQQQYQNHQQHYQHQQQHYQQQEQQQRYQQQQHQQQPPTQSEGELSLKEKLMRKYSKN